MASRSLYQSYNPPAPVALRPTIRVAFANGVAAAAMGRAMASVPAQVREATLDELADTSSYAAQPLRALLAERNAVMTRLNEGEASTDEESSLMCGQVNMIEAEIISRDAVTPDDSIVQLIAAVQVAAEGHELGDMEAARAIVQARRHFGIGYVHQQLLDALPPAVRVDPTTGISSGLAARIAAVEPRKRAAEHHQRDVIDRPAHARQDDAARLQEVRDNNDLNALHCAAIDEVALFEARTAADLHAKLAFMVENDWGDGRDWTKELLADAQRLAFAALPGTLGQPVVRGDWDAAWAAHEAAIAADVLIRAKHDEATAAGHVPDELERKWDASGTRMGDAEWAVFQTPAPDLAALDWKLTLLTERQLRFDDDIAARLIADVRGIQSAGLASECVDPHPGWYAEHIQAQAAVNASEGRDADAEDLLFKVQHEIEQNVTSTPATTRDGVIAKLAMIVQYLVEGSEPNADHCAAALRDCIRVTGMGSLADAFEKRHREPQA